MNLQVLIFDDEKEDIEIIKNDLYDFNFNIDCTNDIENVKKKYDIVLMDIELKQQKNGIDYVKEVFSNSEVIYITGYSKYCTKVYETSHIYFLLKPYNKKDFNKAINKAIDNINEKRKNMINVKTKDRYVKIKTDDIYCIESQKRKIIIHVNNKKYETYNTIKSIINYLPKYFIICHNSFIINLNKVRELTKNSFILENDVVIPISQKKYKEVKDKLLTFIGGIYE